VAGVLRRANGWVAAAWPGATPSVLVNVVADDGPAGANARARLTTAGEAATPAWPSSRRSLCSASGGGRSSHRRAIDDLLALVLPRSPVGWLMARRYEPRANVTA
jgi:hypothetical protein